MAGARIVANIGYVEARVAATNEGELELEAQLVRELTLSQILPSEMTPLQVGRIQVRCESFFESLQGAADREALISSSETATTRRLLTAMLSINPLDSASPPEPPLRIQHLYRALTNIPARYRMRRSFLLRDGSTLSALRMAHDRTVRQHIEQMEAFITWAEGQYEIQSDRGELSLGLNILIAAGLILLSDKEIPEDRQRYLEQPREGWTPLEEDEENDRQIEQADWEEQATAFLEQAGQEYRTPWNSQGWLEAQEEVGVFNDDAWLHEEDDDSESDFSDVSSVAFDSDDLNELDAEPEDGGANRTRAINALLQDVSVDTIPDDREECGICGLPYLGLDTDHEVTEIEEALREVAVKLPGCQHIFGRECISKWLADATTCPTCRHDYANEL